MSTCLIARLRALLCVHARCVHVVTYEVIIIIIFLIWICIKIGTALHQGTLSLADAVIALLRSDRPDGLFTTMVTSLSIFRYLCAICCVRVPMWACVGVVVLCIRNSHGVGL